MVGLAVWTGPELVLSVLSGRVSGDRGFPVPSVQDPQSGGRSDEQHQRSEQCLCKKSFKQENLVQFSAVT